MTRKILIGIEAVLFIIALSACKNNETPTAPKTPANASITTPVPDTTANASFTTPAPNITENTSFTTFIPFSATSEITPKETTAPQWSDVAYHCELGSIYFRLPNGWNYSVQKYNPQTPEEGYSISFYPEDVKEGEIIISWQNQFGVCGTELKPEEDITLNHMHARKGTFVNHSMWNFIYFTEEYEKYVILANNTENWQENDKKQVMEILDTLVFDAKES